MRKVNKFIHSITAVIISAAIIFSLMPTLTFSDEQETEDVTITFEESEAEEYILTESTTGEADLENETPAAEVSTPEETEETSEETSEAASAEPEPQTETEEEEETDFSAFEEIGTVVSGPVINGVLAYPLPEEYGTITSSFGYRTGEYEGFHTGIDISADNGTLIYAVKAGKVIASGYGSYQGNYIVIDHGSGVYTEYHHMSVRHAAEGDQVEAGQIIGRAGSTGTASGDHLHFMLMFSDHGYDIGTAVDPYDYIFAGDAANTVNSLDLSSNRLIVVDPSELMFEDSLVSSYKGIYLFQFTSEADTKLAYLYYMSNAESVEADTGISVAEGEAAEDVITDTVMTESDNPFTELAETEDVGSFDIALIDTGTDGADASVSMIGDDIRDENGHGTSMLRFIREQDPDAKVLSVKALGADGKGDISAVYAAIQYAISQNVKIINLSISARASGDSSVIEDAIIEAEENGILVVGAAGNNGKNAAYYIPGGIERAVIAGSASANGVKLGMSNWGDSVDFNVVSESTSEAAAKLSGFINANGFAAIEENLNKGLIFAADYEADNTEKDGSDSDPGYVVEGTYYYIDPGDGFSVAADTITAWGRPELGDGDLILLAKVDGETVICYCVHPWDSRTPDGNQTYISRTETRNALGYVMEKGVHEVGQCCFGLGELESQFITQLAVMIVVRAGYGESADSVIYNRHTNSYGGAILSFYEIYCNVFGQSAADAHIGYAKSLASEALAASGNYLPYVSGWQTSAGSSAHPYQEVITYNPVRAASVTVRKTTSDTGCTAQLEGNAMYSQNFSGAEFLVSYTDINGNAKTETCITGSDGTFTVGNVKVGTTFIATETKAPAGYRIDSSVQSQQVGDSGLMLTFSDTPLFDPIGVLLQKTAVQNETGTDKRTCYGMGDEQ